MAWGKDDYFRKCEHCGHESSAYSKVHWACLNLHCEPPMPNSPCSPSTSTMPPGTCVTSCAGPTTARSLTLPTDSQVRKDYPLLRGVLRYFPAALAGVARISKLGNDKHNPGQELHHARGKSMDHGDCVVRHLMDVQDLLASQAPPEKVLDEVDQFAWRALALSQELHEKFGAPMAPGAR